MLEKVDVISMSDKLCVDVNSRLVELEKERLSLIARKSQIERKVKQMTERQNNVLDILNTDSMMLNLLSEEIFLKTVEELHSKHSHFSNASLVMSLFSKDMLRYSISEYSRIIFNLGGTDFILDKDSMVSAGRSRSAMSYRGVIFFIMSTLHNYGYDIVGICSKIETNFISSFNIMDNKTFSKQMKSSKYYSILLDKNTHFCIATTGELSGLRTSVKKLFGLLNLDLDCLKFIL